MQARKGNLQRTGSWAVPRRMEADAHTGDVIINFTRAVITHPLLDLTVLVTSGNMNLVILPEVDIDMDSVPGMAPAPPRRTALLTFLISRDSFSVLMVAAPSGYGP